MNQAISIITICYNNLPELIQTCASVDIQTTPPMEHLIINGSTDSKIKDYLSGNPQPLYRKWLNEPDNGIADAFNKGIVLSKGKIINILNSGDEYFNEHVLSKVTSVFEKNASVEWMHSKYEFKRSNEWIILGKPFHPEKLYRGMRSLCHQTIFLHKSLHDKYGLYDTSLRIAMDYDFICRIANEPFYFSRKILIKMQPGGMSNINYLASLKEMRMVYTKHFGNSLRLSIWQWRLKFLYYLLNTKTGRFLFKIKKRLHLENA